MEEQRLPVVASLLAIGSGIVWSFGAITNRKAVHVDAFQYLVWRSIGILVVIEAVSLARGRGLQSLAAWRGGRAMVSANVGLFVASLSFVYAVKTTTPANASFLGSLTPLVAVGFSRLLGERLTRTTVEALVLGLVGLVITVVSDLGAGNMAGNAAALAASVGFALYSISVRSNPQRDWTPALPGYAVLMIVVCGAVSLLKGNPLVLPALDTTYALVHGAVIIVVGTLMFNAAAKHVPAVPMTVFAQTEMVFVPVWAFLVLGLAPKPLTLLGGVIIFVAVVRKAVQDARRAPVAEVVVTPDVPLL